MIDINLTWKAKAKRQKTNKQTKEHEAEGNLASFEFDITLLLLQKI